MVGVLVPDLAGGDPGVVGVADDEDAGLIPMRRLFATATISAFPSASTSATIGISLDVPEPFGIS